MDLNVTQSNLSSLYEITTTEFGYQFTTETNINYFVTFIDYPSVSDFFPLKLYMFNIERYVPEDISFRGNNGHKVRNTIISILERFFSINEDGLMIAAKRANDDYAEIPYYGVIDKQGTTILEAEYTRLNDQDLEFGGDNTLHLSSHGLSTMTLNQQGQELTGVFNKERIVLPAQYKKVKINEETISALREDNQWEV